PDHAHDPAVNRALELAEERLEGDKVAGGETLESGVGHPLALPAGSPVGFIHFGFWILDCPRPGVRESKIQNRSPPPHSCVLTPKRGVPERCADSFSRFFLPWPALPSRRSSRPLRQRPSRRFPSFRPT